jgi:hypothetical protein
MPTYVQRARPQRRPQIARPVRRAAVIARPALRRTFRAPARNIPPLFEPTRSPTGYHSDPYVDYGRFLTPEGGILIAYKDLDLRLRHGVSRVLAWSAATGFEAWILLHHSPVGSGAINLACFFVAMIVNAVIVWKPPELYRSLEIRPDCMILEGRDVFWLRMMADGLPEFHKDEEGNMVLSGIYGTRHVEYLTARRFDEYDRMPEVFAAHLKQAIEQLWAPVLGLNTDHRNSAPRQRQ